MATGGLMYNRIYLTKMGDGQTHTVKDARLICAADDTVSFGLFRIMLDCCPDVFYLTKEQFDERVSIESTPVSDPFE